MQALGTVWPYLALAGLVALIFAIEQRWRGAVTRVEEAVLATLLAIITLVSFGQVVARYGFSSGWGGSLEFTRVLFAWLILFGMGYGLKMNLHLGVDALVRLLPPVWFRAVAIAGALACLLYGVVFLYSDWLRVFGANAQGGAVDYWWKMLRAGIGMDDLRFAGWMRQLFGVGDRVPRWLAYLMLPIGLALFTFRSIEAAVAIATGRRETTIASHEAEELVAANKDVLKE